MMSTVTKNALIAFSGMLMLLGVPQSAEAKKSLKYMTPKNKVAYKVVAKKKRITKKNKRVKATRKRSVARATRVKKSSGRQIDASVTMRNGRARIDFEDLIIQGQLKKADTVYLFERGENQLPTLVKKKENFRNEMYENYLN